MPTRAGSFILRRLYCSSSPAVPYIPIALFINIYLISSSLFFFLDFCFPPFIPGDSLLFAAANIRPCTDDTIREGDRIFGDQSFIFTPVSLVPIAFSAAANLLSFLFFFFFPSS